MVKQMFETLRLMLSEMSEAIAQPALVRIPAERPDETYGNGQSHFHTDTGLANQRNMPVHPHYKGRI